jgi:hypothetical protein
MYSAISETRSKPRGDQIIFILSPGQASFFWFFHVQRQSAFDLICVGLDIRQNFDFFL